MRGMFGCAGVLALIAYLLGLPFSLFFTVDHWSHRLLIACMPAAFTFVATILLCLRDHSSQNESIAFVRRSLLDRENISDDEFVAHDSNSNPKLLLQTRDAIAKFFDVPASKLRPNDDLRAVLRADKLEPSFEFYVVESVISDNTDSLEPFMFGMEGLANIVDLSVAIEKMLEGFDAK
jgi:hypothetical protein